MAWIIYWAMSTKADCRGIVTANTDTQLRTKTWPELAKWHRLSINEKWFTYTATSLFANDPQHAKTWRMDAIPWAENNTEAFAGLHNQGRRILVVYDEASAIADSIYEVTEGALTDENTEILWLCCGNPTRNTGRFHEFFGRLAHRWFHRQIDCRDVEGINKTQIAQWQDDYGEDSDFFRVRVRGQFPKSGTNQFISSEVIHVASQREPVPTLSDPIVIGVDVARFGDDETVIKARRGLDASSIPMIRLRGADTMMTVGRVAALYQDLKADMVFVDETGVGAGVVDRLRQLGIQVIGVNNGMKPDRPAIGGENVGRKDAEMWAAMRLWLSEGGAIEDDHDLKSQLEGREFSYNVHNQLMLEPKDMMKKRGLASPDIADSLALTFAHPVQPKDAKVVARGGYHRAATEFNPFEERL